MIPSGTKRIGEVAVIKGGRRLPRGEVVHSEPTPYPYLRVVDFTDHGVDAANVKYITADAHASIARYTISIDDLYISIAGTVGRVGIVPASLSGANLTENAAKITSIDPSVDKTFLMYFLRSPLGQAQVLSKAGGAAQPKLALYRIAEIEFPAPSLETQKRIAAILGLYDDLIEVNQRRVEVLEEMARGLFEEWFVRFRFPGHEDVPIVDTPDGPLPEGWVLTPLKSWCSLMRSGSTPPRKVEEYWKNGSLPWYTTGELWDGFLLGSSEQVSKVAIEDGKARVFEADTLFMAIYGSPTVGRMGITTERCSTNQASLGMRPDQSVCGLWLLYFTLFSLRAKFNSLAQGAAQQNISKAKVAETVAVQPPKALADRFEALVDPMMRLRQGIEKANVALAASRDLLLPRLISGQLSVEAAERELEDAA